MHFTNTKVKSAKACFKAANGELLLLNMYFV